MITVAVTLVTAQVRFTPAADSRRPVAALVAKDIPYDSLVTVIVEFREPPLYIARMNGNSQMMVADVEQRFEQFIQDLRSNAAVSINGRTFPVRPIRRFYRVFYGMSVEMPYALSLAARDLPYVKNVHLNARVRATLHKSVPQIRANEVWTGAGVSGEGVVVGIIDTGIDYLHPALGGSIGPGSKVIGGYDFVNGDTDPMDDNGHGTHVAGIVAADNDEIKGVAPKAKLFALKVLDENGGGDMDVIIAAVERTVDLNEDGNTDDKLDIVNMSLGSERGDPDDAASVAVDNASMLGVTFVVAAGNSGDADHISGKEGNYFYSGMETIGSPGTSRRAITVGAVDSVNKMAYFSSKGPAGRNYAVKPDVVAPGVNIRSLMMGGGMLVESGTSMAAPMVAGVAALLRSDDASLTPEQIKSKIVNSSVDLGYNIMIQGAGMVDAVRSFDLSSSAVPTALSFGLDDPVKNTWTKVETVFVMNRKQVAQNYSVSFTGGTAGISLSSDPANFSLAAGETRMLRVSVTVDNTVVPIVNEDIILYGGSVKINGSTDTLRLPWSFVRATKMTLVFSDADAMFVGASMTSYLTPQYEKRFSRVRWIDPKTAEVSGVSMESFDFAVYFRSLSKLVLKGGMNFSGAQTFTFNASDAVHSVHFNGVDNANVPFGTLPNVRRSLRVNMPNGSFFAQMMPGISEVSVSPVGPEFVFHPLEVLLDLQQSKRLVLPQYPSFAGISSDVSVTNSQPKYYHQKLHFTMPEKVTTTRMFSEVISMEKYSGEYYSNTVMVGVDTLDVPGGIYSFDLYMMKESDPKYSSSVSFHTNSGYLKNYYLDMSTRYFSVVNDSVLMGLPSQELATSIKQPSGADLRFGDAPVYLANLSYNNSFGPSIHFSPMFFGSLFEQRYSDVNAGSYAIYDDAGTLLKSNPLNDYPRGPFEAELKRHSLVITSHGYMLRKAKGTLSLRNDVDLSKPVPDAPVFTSLVIRNGSGTPSSAMLKGEAASLRFSSKVLAFPSQLPIKDSTTVHYRAFRSTDWHKLPVFFAGASAEKEGSIFSVPLQAATAVDSSAVDLRIRTVDEYGNAAEMIISPAFVVGNWIDDGTTDVPAEDLTVPQTFTLYQNYPNPFNPATTIRYNIPSRSRVSLKIYNILGQQVADLVNEERSAGWYETTWNANISSGVYFYRLDAVSTVDHQQRFSQLKKMILLK